MQTNYSIPKLLITNDIFFPFSILLKVFYLSGTHLWLHCGVNVKIFSGTMHTGQKEMPGVKMNKKLICLY